MSKTRKSSYYLNVAGGEKKCIGCLEELQFAYNFWASFLVLIVYVFEVF